MSFAYYGCNQDTSRLMKFPKVLENSERSAILQIQQSHQHPSSSCAVIPPQPSTKESSCEAIFNPASEPIAPKATTPRISEPNTPNKPTLRWAYQIIRPPAYVKPAPTEQKIILSPSSKIPSSAAQPSAMETEAADVLPYLPTVTTNFS